MTLLATFNCEICYRAKLDAARDLVTPIEAGTVFGIEFENVTNGKVLDWLLQKAGIVYCPRNHVVDTDEVRELGFTDGDSIPRGYRVDKKKAGGIDMETTKISNEVLAVLSSLTFVGNTVRIERPLERKLYEKVNKALEACGGIWNKKAKAHVFEGMDAESRVNQVIVTGEFLHPGDRLRDLGFFPTPAPLAKQLVALAGVKAGHKVLEPSAGTGRLLDAILEVRDTSVWICERDVAMRQALAKRHGSNNVYVMEPANDDFMHARADECFHHVVMNPPFYKVGLGDHLDHVRHAFGMLREKGTLAAILPSGVLFREDRRHREFRSWALDKGGELAELPEGSFKESGTNVNTCTLVMER